jgi:hypothetical protein
MRNPLAMVAEKFRGWSNAQRGLAILLVAVFCFAVVSGKRLEKYSVSSYAPHAVIDQVLPQDTTVAALDEKELQEMRDRVPAANPVPMASKMLANSGALPPSTPSPLIAHNADLSVATKEFAKSREIMEEILERHRGYAAKLRMVGQKSGSLLSATLRVPATELGGTVSDLKALGDVEREEQAADEITQQHADLEARLTNARNTLRRLQELLQKQTYPDGNVRELQRQIANASAEVARLEAERQSTEQRVVFANLFFTLRETVATPTESFGAELKSALASGFGDAMASLSTLLVLLIGRGPVVVVWCAILWLPVRWAWRRLAGQARTVTQEA